jgi:hypothetical protein
MAGLGRALCGVGILAALSVGGSALAQAKFGQDAPFYAADCKYIKQFGGASASGASCNDERFWNDTGFKNAARDAAFATKKTCLGIRATIDAYLDKNPNGCRRLASKNYSNGLNRRFIDCLASGGMAGGVVWTQRSTNWKYIKSAAEPGATISEMCRWYALKGEWVGPSAPAAGKGDGKGTAKKGGR